MTKNQKLDEQNISGSTNQNGTNQKNNLVRLLRGQLFLSGR